MGCAIIVPLMLLPKELAMWLNVVTIVVYVLWVYYWFNFEFSLNNT